MGGVARRNWAGNTNAMDVCRSFNESNKGVGYITIPHVAQETLVRKLVTDAFRRES
jgi:urocanate hydratase